MSQSRFDFGGSSTPRKSILQKCAEYDVANLRAAGIILETPDRYRGLTLDWAIRVIARLAPDEIRESTGGASICTDTRARGQYK